MFYCILYVLVSTTLLYLMERNQHFNMIVFMFTGMKKQWEWNLPVQRLQVISTWQSQCAFFLHVHCNNLIPQDCYFKFRKCKKNHSNTHRSFSRHFKGSHKLQWVFFSFIYIWRFHRDMLILILLLTKRIFSLGLGLSSFTLL